MSALEDRVQNSSKMMNGSAGTGSAGMNGSAVNGGGALAGLEPSHERPTALADGLRSNGELHPMEKTQGDKDK